ncbi:MAG: TfoX/Sxy family protein [Gemmatimonadota bacterium]|nr:TfoX/Sxy family protein [Gemmatimonadota bacterium]
MVDQLDADCAVSARKMFGEYGLYSGSKFIGAICDDRLFIKPTDAGRAYIGDPVEAPPYPGARDSFLIEDGIEDGEWLSELVRVTAAEIAGAEAEEAYAAEEAREAEEAAVAGETPAHRSAWGRT